MFGIYSNKRISEAESKILKSNPDDYNWYCVYVNSIFNDDRFFQVREDIELPNNEDDEGVVLMFQGGDIVYFKTLKGDVTEEVLHSVYEVCSYLYNMFHSMIMAYIVFPPDCEVKARKIEGDSSVIMFFSAMQNDNGEETIDKLEKKLKNREEFTYLDSIDHMLLPYFGFKDKQVFQEKFENYMDFVNEVGSE